MMSDFSSAVEPNFLLLVANICLSIHVQCLYTRTYVSDNICKAFLQTRFIIIVRSLGCRFNRLANWGDVNDTALKESGRGVRVLAIATLILKFDIFEKEKELNSQNLHIHLENIVHCDWNILTECIFLVFTLPRSAVLHWSQSAPSCSPGPPT